MDNHFKKNINLPNSHHAVLGHCSLLVKNLVFGILDQIAPKLPQKIRRKKKSRIKDSPRRDFLWDSAPHNPKFHRLDLFFIFLEKSKKNCISFIWFLEFCGGIFIILFDRFLEFFTLFLKAKFKNAKMGEILIADYT